MTEAREVAERLLRSVPQGVEAEAVVLTGTLSLTRFANSFIHQNVSEAGASVHLRVALDGRVASGDGSRTDDEGLRDLVERTIEAARLRDVDELWPGLTPPHPIDAVDHHDAATERADPALRAALVATFVDAGDGMAAAGFCSTEGWEGAYAGSAGHVASGRVSKAVLDGIHQTGTSAGSGHAASIAVDDLDAAAVGAEAARRARDSASPFDTKPGEYEVVLGPEAVGTIATFFSAYAFNGKAFVEDRSLIRLGEVQFDGKITFVEDPEDPRAISLPFDGEGSRRRRVTLIEEGVSTAVTHDRRTAAKAGTETTGNHLLGSSSAPVATNMFVAPGEASVADMIAAVERGLYVSTFNYCRVLDEKTLVVTGLTRNGTFMIENGRLAGAVTNLRFTQSFAEALGPGKVLGVGDDARFADSEFGSGSTHVPTLHLAGWNFTGGAAG